MSGTQAGVMWMGLLLIVFRLFTTQQWADLKMILGAGASTTSTSTKKSTNPGASAIPGDIAKGIFDPFGVESAIGSFIGSHS